MRKFVILLAVIMSGSAVGVAGQSEAADDRSALMKLERESHQWWFEQDAKALSKLMVDDYRFVAPNGTLETKAMILGTGQGPGGKPRALQVESLRVEPEEVVLRGDTAIVVSIIHMKATVGGRPAPGRLRVLSMFARESAQQEWHLAARSTTPILSPPGR